MLTTSQIDTSTKEKYYSKLILLLRSELKNCAQFTYDLKLVSVFGISSLLSSKILDLFHDGKLLDLCAKLKKTSLVFT